MVTMPSRKVHNQEIFFEECTGTLFIFYYPARGSILLPVLAGIFSHLRRLLRHGIKSHELAVLPDNSVLAQAALALQRLGDCVTETFQYFQGILRGFVIHFDSCWSKVKIASFTIRRSSPRCSN